MSSSIFGGIAGYSPCGASPALPGSRDSVAMGPFLLGVPLPADESAAGDASETESSSAYVESTVPAHFLFLRQIGPVGSQIVVYKGEETGAIDFPSPFRTMLKRPKKPDVEAPTLLALLAGLPQKDEGTFGDVLTQIFFSWYGGRAATLRVMAESLIPQPSIEALKHLMAGRTHLPTIHHVERFAESLKVPPHRLVPAWAADACLPDGKTWNDCRAQLADVSSPAAAGLRAQLLMNIAAKIIGAGEQFFTLENDFNLKKAVMCSFFCLAAGIHPRIVLPVIAATALHFRDAFQNLPSVAEAFARKGHLWDAAMAFQLASVHAELAGDCAEALRIAKAGIDALPALPLEDQWYAAELFRRYAVERIRELADAEGERFDPNAVRRPQGDSDAPNGMAGLTRARWQVVMTVLKGTPLWQSIRSEDMFDLIHETFTVLDPKGLRDLISSMGFRNAILGRAKKANIAFEPQRVRRAGEKEEAVTLPSSHQAFQREGTAVTPSKNGTNGKEGDRPSSQTPR